ncbi:FliM/FliN family flagellar motor switch protein [uncultured Ilyobacter sp.]|uniref:FliM/FliN family flagellar motor switch protein n=1 Tax=uncultured Ilyobacter sp. TaxID=544433 RepID=UPI0029F58E4B|nr:FliM/FliN family flagellar motor switch protein [uncultured Ilyobacter sp.]
MIVDENELDSMKNEADQPAEAADSESAVATEAPPPEPTSTLPPQAARSPELERILRLKVPVIVQLARRRVSVSMARKLSMGMIIEFDKEADKPLELLINNQLVGWGETVKVGEHFGLRIDQIADRAARIRSLGG